MATYCVIMRTVHSGKGKTLETGNECDCQGLGRREREIGGTQRIFRTGNLLCMHYHEGYMSLHICSNPWNVQHKREPLCKLWTLSDHDVSM